jgi:hypothetical protein
MAQTPQVGIVGMRALRRDLMKMGEPGGALVKAMSAAGREAAEPVAAATRSRLPQDTGRLAGDVRVTPSRTGAGVRMGRSSIRYAGWVEFGGHRKAPHESSRAYQPRGRYMFPAAIQLAPRAAQIYDGAITRIVNNYPWTNTTANGEAVHD